ALSKPADGGPSGDPAAIVVGSTPGVARNQEVGLNNLVDFSAGLGDVAISITSFLILDGDELRRVYGVGSVDRTSGAYEAGYWVGVFGTVGLGRLVVRPPVRPAPLVSNVA